MIHGNNERAINDDEDDDDENDQFIICFGLGPMLTRMPQQHRKPTIAVISPDHTTENAFSAE